MNNPSVPFRLPKSFLRGRAANRILPADNLDVAGRKALRKLFMEMVRHQPGIVSGDDPLAIHDMRVALRRMRAAFELFGQAFPRKAVKNYGRFLKDLGGLLGVVRDTEVLIGNAQAYLETLPAAQRPAFQPLIDFLQARREAGRGPLLDFLAGKEYLDFTQEFPIFLSETETTQLQAGEPSRVSELAPLLIMERLGKIRSFDGHLASLSLEQLHALRGSIKRLRYALEFFREPLGPQAGVLITGLKGVQDHLGHLNDANVAAQAIQEFINDWDTRQFAQPAYERLSSVPFLPYLTRTLSQRDELVQTFPAVWEQFNTIDFRRRLARALARL